MTKPTLALMLWISLPLCAAEMRMPLSGEWRFRLDSGDRGAVGKWWASSLPDRVRLPGSLQEQGFGDEVTAETKWVAHLGERKSYPDWRTHPMFEKYRQGARFRFPYWLQPKKHYVGLAWYQRDIDIPAAWSGKRITLYLERCHWKTAAWVDGVPLGDNDSLGTPHIYELAGIAPGRHTVTVAVDNRMIYPLGANAHSVGDQTQTAWNGIVGQIELRASDRVWIDEVQIYPDVAAKRVHVHVVIGNLTGKPQSGSLTAAAGGAPAKKQVVEAGAQKFTPIEFEYPLGAGARRWDEFSPALYRMRLLFAGTAGSSETEVTFGLREIQAQGTRFQVNGRGIFLRGTLECAIFPLTGYPPTDVASWKRIMRTAKSYGLNHLRFHSWFPPEAAFAAADEEGVYLHAECHIWAPVTAKAPQLHAYLMRESERLLRRYGNHPSFVMFGLGNETMIEKPLMSSLIQEWQRDRRRIYTGLANANSSIIPEYDYYIGREFEQKRFRYQLGWPPQPKNVWFLDRPPQTTVDYRDAVERYGKPLVSHEIVQRCSYPDLDQAGKYTGSLKAAYLDIARDQLVERGMLAEMRDFVLASGKWQVQQFKEEIEAALRTPGMGGFQLLDLHDFPGQGAALVGILDAFWDSKGYVTPAEFTRFNNVTVPLARMAKRTWTSAETFSASVEVAHFGPTGLDSRSAEWEILNAAGNRAGGARLAPVPIPTGALTSLGGISFKLGNLPAPAKYRLLVRVAERENDWDFWVYPERLDSAAAAGVIVAKQLDDALLRRLEGGATVLLLPAKEAVRGKLQQCFTSIYWDGPWTNGGESETLGILTDPKHPAFRRFPTEFHSNWQWFELLSQARPMTLDGWGVENPWPKTYRPLIQLIDDWNQNRKLAVLAEARVGAGKLAICTLDLESDLDKRMVARQFRRSLMDYLGSNAFQPATELTAAQIKGVLQTEKGN